jgi:hypothetical protein
VNTMASNCAPCIAQRGLLHRAADKERHLRFNGGGPLASNLAQISHASSRIKACAERGHEIDLTLRVAS